MPSPERPTRTRRIGVGTVLTVALSLVLATMAGPPTGKSVAGAPGASREYEEQLAAPTSAACADDKDRDGQLAAIGTVVDVDGIAIVLEGADVALGPNSLTVAVTGKDSRPLTGALVYLTTRMPAMDHGVSAYPATEVAAGRYRADDVSLGMSGEWVVTVEVIRQARSPISAAHVITIIR